MGKGGRLLAEKRGQSKLEYMTARIQLISNGRFKTNAGTLSRIERGRRIPTDRARIEVIEIAYGIEQGMLYELFRQDIRSRKVYSESNNLSETSNSAIETASLALKDLYDGKPIEAQSRLDEMVENVLARLDMEKNNSQAVNELRLKLSDLYCKTIWVQHSLSKPETVFDDTESEYKEAIRHIRKVIGTTRTSETLNPLIAEAEKSEIEAKSLFADTYYIKRNYRYGARWALRVLRNPSIYAHTKQRSLRAWLLCSGLSDYSSDNLNVPRAVGECTAFIGSVLEENTPDSARVRMMLWESIARTYILYAEDEKQPEDIRKRLKEAETFVDKVHEAFAVYQQLWNEPLPSFQFHIVRSRLNILKVARKKRLPVPIDMAIALATQGFALARPNYPRFWFQTKEIVEKLRITSHFSDELASPLEFRTS
ncbi:MAG: hypothetical protein K8L97_20650 [Anaerolineae bacterium]|nr:hypothetical protein [Anaerolineae bacterium]